MGPSSLRSIHAESLSVFFSLQGGQCCQYLLSTVCSSSVPSSLSPSCHQPFLHSILPLIISFYTKSVLPKTSFTQSLFTSALPYLIPSSHMSLLRSVIPLMSPSFTQSFLSCALPSPSPSHQPFLNLSIVSLALPSFCLFLPQPFRQCVLPLISLFLPPSQQSIFHSVSPSLLIYSLFPTSFFYSVQLGIPSLIAPFTQSLLPSLPFSFPSPQLCLSPPQPSLQAFFLPYWTLSLSLSAFLPLPLSIPAFNPMSSIFLSSIFFLSPSSRLPFLSSTLQPLSPPTPQPSNPSALRLLCPPLSQSSFH